MYDNDQLRVSSHGVFIVKGDGLMGGFMGWNDEVSIFWTWVRVCACYEFL